MDTLHGRTPLGGDPGFDPDESPVAGDEFDVIGLTRHELDVTNRDATVKALIMAKPDVVIHLAAYTAVDRAEIEEAMCFAVNATGTENMSIAAHEVGAHLITISTDYVFDGRKGSAYVESDTPNPLNVYGATKRVGETLCSAEDTIVRTSWVMGVRGKNVVHVIADRAASGGVVRFVDDQMGTVTASSDLARSLVTLARERIPGTWHVANSESTTWFEIAQYVGELLGRAEGFATPITTSDLEPAPLAVRPARSDLSSEKFATIWSPLPLWQDGVARLVRGRDQLAADA